MKTPTTKDQLYKLLQFIPQGKVLTYKKAAEFLGLRSYCLVGGLLHQNKDEGVPCYKVVFSDVSLAPGYVFGGPNKQKAKLVKAGIVFKGEKVASGQVWQPTNLLKLYFALYKKYGEPAGFWACWCAQTKSKGRHSREEIMFGAVLTQNVSWHNVELVLQNLRAVKANSLASISQLGKKNKRRLEILIRPSGFYRQKTERLLSLAQLVLSHGGPAKFFRQPDEICRQQLLALAGIGQETADAILLYAGGKPFFVVDAYTRRFVKHYNLTQDLGYGALQEFFASHLPKNVLLYQEFHALIIEWGKSANNLGSE